MVNLFNYIKPFYFRRDYDYECEEFGRVFKKSKIKRSEKIG